MKAASAMAARMAEAFQRNKIHPFPEMTAGTYTTSVSESARSPSSPLWGLPAVTRKATALDARAVASPVRVMYACGGSSMVQVRQ